MSTRNLIRCLFITFIATGAASLRADETNQPSRGFTREQIREQFKNMTPEERRARLEQFRAKGAGQLRSTNQFEQLKNLSPEERRAKLQQLREQRAGLTNSANARINPEERRAKIKSRLEDIRKKKDQGTLTPMEQKQLDRLEIITKREQGTPSVPGPNPSSSASATTNSNAQSNQSSTKQ